MDGGQTSVNIFNGFAGHQTIQTPIYLALLFSLSSRLG